jgi:hypothetical protein
MLLRFEEKEEFEECFDFVLPVAGEPSWLPAASRREISESFRDDMLNLTGMRDALCSLCNAVDHLYCYMREGKAAKQDPRTVFSSCPMNPIVRSHIGNNSNLMGHLLLDIVNSEYETIFN